MREMQINGETWVPKSEVEQQDTEDRSPLRLWKKPLPMEITNVAGFGVCSLRKGYVYTKVDIEYLEQALQAVKSVNNFASGRKVCLAWCTGYPAVLGHKDDGHNVIGTIIAPTIDEHQDGSGDAI